MSSSVVSLKGLWIALAAGVLAIFIGFQMATPDSLQSLAIIALGLGTLALPLVLRWHHAMAIASMNMGINVFFFPGAPALWIAMCGTSLTLAVMGRWLDHRIRFHWEPSVAIPLCVLAAVIVLTAALTGGIGSRVTGSSLWGGKRYVSALGAIMAFFALSTRSIPKSQAGALAASYYLGGATYALSNLVYALGPSFYVLFPLFAVEVTGAQTEALTRLPGVAFAAGFAIYALVQHYGIRGIMTPLKPLKLILFMVLFAVGLFGGFRSSIVFLSLLLAVLFIFEGLLFTRYSLGVIGALVLTLALLLPFVDYLPLSVQRSLSVLPIQIDPVARQDARGSLDWRIEMWRIVSKEVPQYIFLGKGYSFSGTDLYLTEQARQRGFYSAYESALITGNYHHGVLTLIIPFGIWGFMAFFWFQIAALRILWLNYKNGDPALGNINTFLISFFVARSVFYVFLYGQFDLDLVVFTSITGLSLAVNDGVRREAVLPSSTEEPATA